MTADYLAWFCNFVSKKKESDKVSSEGEGSGKKETKKKHANLTLKCGQARPIVCITQEIHKYDLYLLSLTKTNTDIINKCS